MKVLTVVGTRPEIIRLSEVIKELDRKFEHVLVHTGQNYDYELSQIFFDQLGLRKPDHFLEAAGKTAAETVGNVIARIDAVLEQENPDALLVLGDTNSCFAAYSAKRRKIPVFHMEAGNRSFDMRVPEEINRRIIDHISDINMPYSDNAKAFLLAEGLPPNHIVKTGSPMFEVLMAHKKEIEASTVLKDLGLTKNNYFVVSFHREENVTDSAHLVAIVDALVALHKEYQLPIIVSAHPRTQQKLEASQLEIPDGIKIMKPMGLFDFVHLEMHARCTISDSGTISEESSILNFPAVNMREAHERPEAMEEGSVILSGLKKQDIIGSVKLALSYEYADKRDFMVPRDYDVPNVSKKVAKIIQSYTDYINRRTWMKHA